MTDTTIDGLADLGRQESERQIREAIEEALRLLPEGKSDGVCHDCGARIEPERLELLPGATQCSVCARKRSKLGPRQSFN